MSHGTWHTGAVTVIQRFGSVPNFNVHFHMLFLDGAYVTPSADSTLRLVPMNPPTRAELTHLTRTLARRIGWHLERHGWHHVG